MQVLLVNNQLQLGGAETVVHQLHSRIPNTRLLVPETPFSGAQVMYPRLLSRLNHSRLHEVTEKWFPMFEWTDRRVAQLRSDPADIIHFHNFHGDYASIETLAGLIRAKRVVWTFHGLWGVTGGCDHPKGCGGFLRQCGNCPQLGLWPIGELDHTADELSRKIALLGDLPLHVVAPSKYFCETIRSSRVGGRWTLWHIANGVDPSKFKPNQARSGRLKVLVVNRDFRDPHKGFWMVKEALNLAGRTEFEVTLVGLNSTWAVAQLEKRLRIRDLGYVAERSKLAQLYGESHIFLFASPAENFPCVVLEAMASGCCVVATPSGGVMEQMTNGESGFFAANISGSALAEVLDRALRCPDNIAAIGENARVRVTEKFSEDTMIEAHLKLYEDLMNSSAVWL
jgi:glycosyltransferase involved in cell wall biosynthesis